MSNVLFVCTGNTCRSPMAEALFRKYLGDELACNIRSAGTQAWPGDEMSSGTRKVLSGYGIDGSLHRSTALSDFLVDWATDIFAMDRGHIRQILSRFPSARSKTWLYLAPGLHMDEVDGCEVFDPAGHGLGSYMTVCRMLESGMENLRNYLS